MVQRLSNQVGFVVLDPEPLDDTGIAIAVYRRSDPTQLIDYVPRSKRRSWLDELADVGSGSFQVHVDDDTLEAHPDLLDYGNVVRCYLDGVLRFAWIIEDARLTGVSDGEDAGLWWTVSGRGALARLEDAAVYPAGGLAGEAIRQFAGETPGAIMSTLITEAKARQVLTDIAIGFTGTLDSNSIPYTSTLDLRERVGNVSVLDVALRHAALAVDVWMDPTLTLRYYVTRGVDRSIQTANAGPVVWRVAHNLTEASYVDDQAIVNALLIDKGNGSFTEKTDPASVAAYGRKERPVALPNLTTDIQWTRAAEQLFAITANRVPSITVAVTNTEGHAPYADVSIGDHVLAPDPDGVLTKYRVTAFAVSETQDGRPVIVPELATTVREAEQRHERWLASMAPGTLDGLAAPITGPAMDGATTGEVSDAVNAHLAAATHASLLDDLSDVSVAAPATGDMIYRASTALWAKVAGTKAAGKVPAIQADGSVAWAAGAGAVPPAWIADIETRPNAAVSQDDEFNGTALDAKWTTVLTSGSINPVVGNGMLIVAPAGQTSGHMAAILQSMGSLAAPVTIEIAARFHSYAANYLMLGPCFTGGVATTSPAWWFMPYQAVTAGGLTASTRYASAFTGAWTTVGTDRQVPPWGTALFLRATWHDTNSFSAWVSYDGKNWWDYANTNPRAAGGPNPPTHFGIGFSTWGTNPGHRASIDYFRVNP